MNEKQYNSEDQIHFAGVKNYVWAFLQEFFRFVEFTQTTIRRKIWFLVAGAIVGVGVALLYYTYKPQLYQAEMVLLQNKLTKRAYGEILQQLNMMVTTGGHEDLAQALQVPSAVASPIIAISAFNMLGHPLTTDTVNKPFQPFKVSFLLGSTIQTDTLQTALVNYINNVPYLKRVSETDRESMANRLKLVDSDLAKLDSLKTEYNRSLATGRMPATVYNNAANPAEFYEQSITLINLREASMRMMNFESYAVLPLSPLKLITIPRTRQLPDLMLVMGAVGLFTGFLFGLLLETHKKVMKQ